MSIWKFSLDYQHSEIAYQSINITAAINLPGEIISQSPISYLKKCRIGADNYYIKIYHQAGKGLRKWFGKSRIKLEWENLFFFQSSGIPTPDIVAFGEVRKFGFFKNGVLITKEINNSWNLSNISNTKQQILKNHALLDKTLKQIAEYTQALHQQRFVHNDLKWRNILVNVQDKHPQKPKIFFIDCPLGKRKYGLLLNRGIIKDIACLDKVASQTMSRSQRLRFFLYYQNRSKLSPHDKKMIRQIISFFDGRKK